MFFGSIIILLSIIYLLLLTFYLVILQLLSIFAIMDVKYF
jgi:hypothetical protein